MESLRVMPRSTQLHKIQLALEALFRLVDIYGYFYCEPEQLRMSEEG